MTTSQQSLTPLVLVVGGTGHTGRRVVDRLLAFPGAAETVGALAEEAARQRVQRLVLLSWRGEPGAVRSEAAVRAAS